MTRRFTMFGASSLFFAVALGAFGAHFLKARLSVGMLAVFETGVRYQMLHGLGLLAAAWASERWPGKASSWAGWAFLVGTVLFSGSLYVLALSGIGGFGAVTPFGGVAFLSGWLALALAAQSGSKSLA
ncbi:MAG: hypothetical protein AUK47_18330 [Deltaproteobacteria bacterium CG2_30_63_29]|nr:MAG: hypothetical protein AUK47_18330 [Deltaproteobacteria bacterium CG2_30_63_29]